MWMDKLERKLGRFAVPHLMRYIIFGNVLVYILSLIQPNVIYYLALFPELVLRGQIWRLFTFIFVPSGGNIFMMAITFYCYYWIGSALEATWGSFRFNLYYLIGMLAIIIASLVFKTTGVPVYLNQTLFLALATLYPHQKILYMYIIPMDAMWAGIISAAFMVYDFFVTGASFPDIRILMISSLVGYAVFFVPVLVQRLRNRGRRQAYNRKYMQGRQAAGQRRQGAGQGPFSGYAGENAQRKAQNAGQDRGKIIQGVPFHRCHVCGITEVDDPNMTFRYCSQCNGNFEYCEKHLRNHEHVK